MSTRVVIIGLDGATWTVLQPFMDDGDMPNLAKLIGDGAWGDLESTIPPLSAPAWSTFLTGKSPARHGIFHFVDWADESGDGAGAKLVNGASIDSPTIWDVAAHNDRKIGAINVPMSYPPRPVNGFMVTGLLTPPDAPAFTYPPELSSRLNGYQIDLDRFIAAKPFAEAEDGQGKQKREVKADVDLMNEFHAMEDQRARVALDLMQTEPWDIFTVVFTATDRMGHYLWQYHREADLDGTPESAELHDAVRGFYRRMDEAIGDLREAAGDDSVVMVMSDHGMGPIYSKNTHWNNWLRGQGFVKLTKSSSNTVDGWLIRLGLSRDKLRRLAKKIPGFLESKRVSAITQAPTAEVDKEASTAYYAKWFDPVGGIHINATGDEREEIRDQLIEQISQVTDPATGAPIVRRVVRPEDCLAGPYLEQAPDLIVIMEPDYGSSDRLSNYSSIVTDRHTIGDPGGHYIEGILVCTGEGISAQPDPYSGFQLEDIAPTALHLMGLEVPSDMDGRVLTEIFDPNTHAGRDVEFSAEMEFWPDLETARPDVSGSVESDEEAVRDRLRALGYFE